MYNYPDRDAILDEVHARPFQDLHAPLTLMQLAVLYNGGDPQTFELQVFEVVRGSGFPCDPGHRGFLFCRQGDQALRYEPHNDFYTLTLYQFGSTEPLPMPPMWQQRLPGAFLVGVEVLFRQKEGGFYRWAAEHFGTNQLNSSSVMSDSAWVCTDFKQQPESGFTRILVEDSHLKLAQAGRLLQRLCEVETYRHTALLSLARARELMPQITTLDQQLASIAQRTGEEDAALLLAELMTLAGAVEALSAATANSFAASEAHFEMVERRTRELREQRVEGLQMVGEFMDRRLDPARRTCQSAAARIEQLSERIARTTELIQSQVNLAIEQQNRDLLAALNLRSRRHLKLQSKLEGLSVIVVAYYMYDLIDLALKNVLPEGGLRGVLLLGLTLSLPIIMLLLYWSVRRLLKGYDEEETAGDAGK